MTPIHLAILLSVTGVVLLVAELALPTHGVLGVIGALSLLGAIGACFLINQWVGLGVLIGAGIASPFVGTLVMNIWPRTPVGKRILLPNVESPLVLPPVSIGQSGITVSELRPMGECEFNGYRIEAISEHGFIPAGSKVKVVAVASDKPTVRAVA